MFASRLPPESQPSRLSKSISEIRASGAAILDLTESNPTRAGIVYPEQEILRAFQDRRALVYDPESLGLLQAREQIAALEGVPAERIVLTASSSEAYSWLFKLLCDPCDEILIPRPSYPLFEFLAGLETVVVRHYPLRYCGEWFVDTQELAKSVTARTRAIVVVNPNNPTGSYLKRHEQQEIAGLCLRHGLALIADEVFADYALKDDPTRAERFTENDGPLAFSLNGLSKLAGLPQMKLGWMIASGQKPLLDGALHRLELIADTYLSVGTPVQYALPALLAARVSVQAQILERLRSNLEALRTRIAGAPASLLNVEGGWYAILQVPRTRSEEDWVAALLRDHNVLVQPGYFYDFDQEAFLIVSLLTIPDHFQNGIDRIVEFLKLSTFG